MGKIGYVTKKRLFLKTLLLAAVLALPLSTMAEVSVNIGIGLPPLIRFREPPSMVVIPNTYVYVAPDVEEEIFFFDGWWWRPWEGRWYRSRHYNAGWSYYKHPPSFYRHVPRDWRHYYRENRWRGHAWKVERLPHHHVQDNWRDWKHNRYWERERYWGLDDRRHQRSESPRSWRDERRDDRRDYRRDDRRHDRDHRGDDRSGR